MGSLTADPRPAAGSRWAPALDLLARAGSIGTPRLDRVVDGPLLSRAAASTDTGRHLLLEVPGDDTVTPPALRDGPTDPVIGAAVSQPPTVTATTAVPIGGPAPLAWYHPTPWPPAVLAEVAIAAVPGRIPGPVTFAALGALLARFHSTGPVPRRGEIPPLSRVLAASRAGLLTAELAAAVDRIRRHTDPPVPVHGQPALGHLLVPAGDRDDLPAAILTGWVEAASGSAALDLGHLLGDIVEIAVLVGSSDPDRAAVLRSRVLDVRRGYLEVAGRVGRGFWARVADGALLRVLDHRCTLNRLLGPAAAPTRLADRLAAQLASTAFREKGFRP